MSGRALIALGALLALGALWASWPIVESTPAEAPRPAPTPPTPDGRAMLMPAPSPVDTRPAVALTPALAAPEATATPASPVAPLLVHVRHADGRPASGGRVALYDADGRLAGQGMLDAIGDWTHAGVDGSAEVLVLGLRVPHACFALDPGRGEHEFTLPMGATLEGYVLIDGAPPIHSVPLALVEAQVDTNALRHGSESPDSVGLAGAPLASLRGGFLTEADGHFLLSGLEPGCDVHLLWPPYFEPEGWDVHSLAVTVPATGLVLALRRPSMIFGRVLGPGGLPATEAILTLTTTYHVNDDSGRGPAANGSSDAAISADGRFEIPIGSPFTRRRFGEEDDQHVTVSLDLHARCAEGSRVHAVLTDAAITREHDLGDLVLEPARRVVLSIVDPSGTPVPSARVRPEVRDGITSVLLSDAAGQVQIDLGDATAGVATVLAAGFDSTRIDLTATSAGASLEVMLTPTCRVHLRIRGPWETDPALIDGWQFRVVMTADGSPYQDTELPRLPGQEATAGPDPMRDEVPASVRGTSWTGTGEVKCSWTVAAPELTLDGLRAGVPLRFSLSVWSAPEDIGISARSTVWDSGDVLLAQGELRELVADLRGM